SRRLAPFDAGGLHANAAAAPSGTMTCSRLGPTETSDSGAPTSFEIASTNRRALTGSPDIVRTPLTSSSKPGNSRHTGFAAKRPGAVAGTVSMRPAGVSYATHIFSDLKPR